MVEQWYASHVLMKSDTFHKDKDRVLMDAVKPAVEALEAKKLIQTFHFLFEPNFEILFRVRLADGAKLEDVKSLVDEKLESIRNLCNRIAPDESYHGEGDPTADWSFGTEGWTHAQKLLEYGSRAALLEREVETQRKPLTAGRLDSQFNIGKMVHCFLNQHGLDTIREAQFHNDRFCERTLRAWGYFDVLDRLKKAEEKLAQQDIQKPPQPKP
jgi:hypothetical protein